MKIIKAWDEKYSKMTESRLMYSSIMSKMSLIITMQIMFFDWVLTTIEGQTIIATSVFVLLVFMMYFEFVRMDIISKYLKKINNGETKHSEGEPNEE